MTSTLYLVRHGETDWNAENRIQGRVDRHLNEQGREQARRVGQKLQELKPAAIYTSPLLRAHQTAEIIASFHNCSLNFDPNLQEAAYGDVEGMLHHEYKLRYKAELEKSMGLPYEELQHFKVVQGAESRAEIVGRVLPSLQRIAAAHGGETIFVVTHGFVMRTLVGYFQKIDDREIHVPNLGVLKLHGNASQILLVTGNSSTSLGASGSRILQTF